MKNIFKVKIHFFFYIIFFIAIITGNFKIFITFTLITMFHELGHIITSMLFRWKIDKVIIMPISIVTIYNIKINTNIIEELLVTVMGPIFQIILFYFIKDNKIMEYNMILLIFNLLPIYPLDGSKLFKILLYNYIPFKYVIDLNIYVSIITIIFLLILSNYNLIIIFISIIFVFKIIDEFNKRKYLFNKFLFERFLYKIKYKKIKTIFKKDDFYKNYYNNFIIENKIVSEEEILSKMFDNKRVL